MRTALPITLTLLLLGGCGESTVQPVAPETASEAPKGKLRVEYYEISKK